MSLEAPAVARRRFARRTAVTRLLGLSTAVPPFAVPQQTMARFNYRNIEASLPSPECEQTLAMTRKLYDRGGIENRHVSVPDFLKDDPEEFEFFPPNWRLEPRRSMEAVMAVYEPLSIRLAEEASCSALEEAGVTPEDVTHLVLSTCTGFFAPGPDILLGQRLGLRPTVRRTIIGFMGCYAGFNGMRTADQIIRSDPESVVLQICIELCTIHWQPVGDVNSLIGNCLFADGCSAAVYAAKDGNGGGLADVRATHCSVADDSLDQMQWRLGATNFGFHLSPQVPDTISRDAVPFVEELLAQDHASLEEVREWAIHPGGRKIVEAARDALELSDEDVEYAFSVLREFGNMSSATIFFVLDRHLRRPGGGSMVALGFGPGLTMEGALLDR